MKRRIAWATLTRAISIQGKMVMNITSSHDAELDTDTYELLIGDMRLPIPGNVGPYQLIEEPKHPCPECKELFATLPALGSHRSAAHHIKGATRKGAVA
jgi:hypothetical protein